MASNRFCADYAKRGTAACKKCKQKLEKGGLRLGKVVPNPFSDDGGDMKQWFHVGCLFETFVRARATTKKIEEPDDIEGWEDVEEEDRNVILKHIADLSSNSGAPKTPKKQAAASKKQATPKNKTMKASANSSGSSPPTKSEADSNKPAGASTSSSSATSSNSSHRDNSFRQFRVLCAKLAEEPSYNAKTSIISDFFKNGCDEDGFKGDLYLWAKLLLPGFVKRVYNVQSKQLVNHFSQIFGTDADEMTEHLEQGDVADTVQEFFEKSSKCPPSSKSALNLQEVDQLLEELTTVTKDDDQIRVLKSITKRCTSNDLKMVIRLIKKDLRINAGAKHVLEAVHPDAYGAFQASRNLRDVIDRVLEKRKNAANEDGVKVGMSKSLSIRASLMTPILPMLAEACKSVEYAMKKCPNGMYAEVKYDGERVQVHKQGNQFSYFSRSLKPVMPHKVAHLKEYIPQAFPHGQDLILDSEVLLIDTNTGTPLPFGTLGVHKKQAFKDASVCLFVFDCVHLNGENLMDKPLKERRRILHENLVEVPNHVKCSEMKHITKSDDLKDMIMDVLRKGLEGLVLKDCLGVYEPGKRHWLKVKKDYLAEGLMADSADLVVLGAFYGTGNKGGMMSSFLMGCYDEDSAKWCTVSKVSGGHDDKTLDKLQTQLDMIKIGKDASKVPSWLKVTKNMVPDFVARDPKKSQVWEIVGAEFTKSEIHTANGISIRFPRVTKIRSDKTWKESTNLSELQDLYEKSKDHENLPDLLGERETPKKQATSSKNEEKTASVKKNDNEPSPKNQQKVSEFLSKTPKKGKVDEKQESSGSRKRKTNDDLDEPGTAKKARRLNMNDTSDATKVEEEVLPNIFKGLNIFLSKNIDDYEKLSRYVIAYDGNLVEDYQCEEASHLVLTEEDEIPKRVQKSAFIVSQRWLLDSIKLQKLQQASKYSRDS